MVVSDAIIFNKIRSCQEPCGTLLWERGNLIDNILGSYSINIYNINIFIEVTLVILNICEFILRNSYILYITLIINITYFLGLVIGLFANPHYKTISYKYRYSRLRIILRTAVRFNLKRATSLIDF